MKLRTQRRRKETTGAKGLVGREALVSASEELLFGRRLRYEKGFADHEDAFLDLNLPGMVRRLPQMLGSSIRLAWQARP